MYFLSRNNDELGFSSFEEEISRRAKNGDTKSCLYIVPTGAQARELINWVTELCSPNAIALPNILSLDDFINRLARYARPEIQLLSDAESAVFIELALKELLRANTLEYFEGSPEPSPKLPIHRGTFERLVAGIAGLKENGITPEKLAEDILRAESDSERMIADRSALRRAHDVAAIFTAYEKKLGTRFTDKYGQYKIVAEYFQQGNIQKAIDNLFSGITDIFIGSFIRLPEPARHILFSHSQVENIRLTFGIDYEKNNPSLFGLQEKLIREADEAGFRFIIPKETNRDISGGIESFQKSLRVFLGNFMHKNAEISSTNIHSYAARTAKEEIRFAAKKIKELIANASEPLELSGICVASYRQDDYAPIAREIFREYGIPANITDRARLDRSPLYLAFNALFDLAEFNFNRRSLLRLLSTPYLNITGKNGERIDAPNLYEVITEFRLHQGSESWREEIEVYVEQAQEEAALVLDKYDKFESDAKLARLYRANHDIQIIENLIVRLRGDKKPAEFHKTMIEIIDECKVVSQLLSSSGPMIDADALEFDTRSYRALMELLEELLDVSSQLALDNMLLPLSYYTERIRVALRTRFAPRSEPGRGVIVTSFEQTIGYEFDHLFLVGLNDGVFPENFSSSLFTLKEHQSDEDDKLIEQRYLFYQTLCTFRDQLYLSWHTSSDDKKSEIMRSQFVDALEEITTLTESLGDINRIYSGNEFFRYAAQLSGDASGIANENGLDKNSLTILENQIPHSIFAQTKRRNDALTEFSGLLPSEELTESEQEYLQAFRNRVYSISQLETYASCPFKFFSKYILGLEPGLQTQAEEGLSGAERGTIIHDTLYQLLTDLRENHHDIRTITDDDYRSVTSALEEKQRTSGKHAKHHPFVRLDNEVVFSPPEPGIAMLQKFIEAERKFEKFITKPSFFEATFGLPIAEEKRDKTLYQKEPIEIDGMKFRGKIDRIDMDEAEGIFSVTDYKSGKTATTREIDEGISLQLPLYLRIAEDLLRAHLGGKEMKGVAGVYHTLLGKDAKQTLALGLRDFVGKAYEGHKGGGKSRLDAEQEEEEFVAIIEKTIGFAKSYVEGITRGEFPLVKEANRETACRYCDYKKVCRVGEAMENGSLSK